MCPPICFCLLVVFFATPSMMIQFICARSVGALSMMGCVLPQTLAGAFFLGPALCLWGGQKTHRFVFAEKCLAMSNMRAMPSAGRQVQSPPEPRSAFEWQPQKSMGSHRDVLDGSTPVKDSPHVVYYNV